MSEDLPRPAPGRVRLDRLLQHQVALGYAAAEKEPTRLPLRGRKRLGCMRALVDLPEHDTPLAGAADAVAARVRQVDAGPFRRVEHSLELVGVEHPSRAR